MKKEIFKAVQGYEELYHVSNLGRVKSLPRMRTWGNRTYLTQERFLKASIHHTGYYKVVLCVDKKMVSKSVHLLVIRAFHPKEEGRPIANHKDGNRLNNDADNLEWVNIRENSSHAMQRRGTKTGYRYVCNGDNKTNPFSARMKINGVCKHLGCFPTALLAYKAAMKFKRQNKIENRYS